MKPPLKKRVPKPRNPFVALAIARKAGEHEKTARALYQLFAAISSPSAMKAPGGRIASKNP